MTDQNATWKLTVEEEDEAPRTLTLDAARVYVIGREEGCDIRLVDRTVTRRHARLAWRAGKGWRLEDLGSRHGTFANGARVASAMTLASGACVQVGDAVLMLLADELGASPTDLTPAAAFARSAKRAPDRLLVVMGPQAGREIPLDRGIVTLGGDPLCTVRFEEPAFEGTQILVRPLAQGRYEVLRQASRLRLYVGIRRAEQQILSDNDLLILEEVGDRAEGGDRPDRVVLELRLLGSGKALPTYPGTPLPVYDLPWLTNRAEGPSLASSPYLTEIDSDPTIVEGPAVDPTPTPDATGRMALMPAPAYERDDTVPDPPSFAPANEDADAPSRPRPSRRPGAGLRRAALAAIVLGPSALIAAAVTTKYVRPPTVGAAGAATSSAAPPVASLSLSIAPSAPLATAVSVAAPAASSPSMPSSAASSSSATPTPSTTPQSTGPRKKPGVEPTGAGEPHDQADAAARAEAALRARVFGGRASSKEIQALRNLCARKNDKACYDRAGLLLEGGGKGP